MVVESADPTALLPLLGNLQSRLHLESLNYTAAPKAVRQAKNHVGVTALYGFLVVAKQDCAALGFRYPTSGRDKSAGWVDACPALPHDDGGRA